MSLISRNARIAGFLYLLLVIVAPLRLMYIPNTLFVTGDASATANNILAHETLFRLGMVSQVWGGVLEIVLVLVLYRLFEPVDRTQAVLMVIFGMFTTPMSLLTDAATLTLAHGADFLSAFDKPQRDALAMLFLRLHHFETLGAMVFWGLWLWPLAVLVYKSRFMPRFLGIWLAINGLAYVLQSFVGLLLPQYADSVSDLLFPVELGEVAFMLWLLIMGAKQRPANALAS